jgi:uncharacterized protein
VASQPGTSSTPPKLCPGPLANTNQGGQTNKRSPRKPLVLITLEIYLTRYVTPHRYPKKLTLPGVFLRLLAKCRLACRSGCGSTPGYRRANRRRPSPARPRLGKSSPPSIAYAEGVSLDWKCGALAEGLVCYRNAEFFLAHEHWESVWLGLDEPEKSFLQALIQMTAAFHHLRAGNHAGATSLLKRALRRLELCPGCFGAIIVTPLCAEIRDWVWVLESASPSIPVAFPQICPIDQPSERAPGR